MANKNTDLSLIKKYEEMVGQDKKYYFDSDQIEDIALYYEEKEDYNEALNVVNFGLSLHSMNEDLSVLKVRYLLSLDFIEEAGIIIKSINSHDSVDYFLINAELLFAEGKEDKALNYINSFTLNHTLDAEDCISIINIMYGYITADKIINFIHNILEKKIELNDVLISIIAGIYIENNISEEAIKIIESYIDEQPYNLNLWFELARAYRSIEKYDEAIDSCDYALAIKNNDIDTLQFKISLLCDCNKFKEAEPLIFDLENFSDTEEQKEDADETASDFYAITENPRGAIKYLEYILPKRERKAPIFLKIAEAHFDMGNSPMAEENINLAITEEPSNSEVRMNASLLYLNADFIDKSVEQINYITQNDSNYSGLTKQVIAKTFLLSSNHWRDGIDLIKECLEENPNDLDSLYLLIRIYCKYGMYNDAIKQIEVISNYQSIDDETVTKYNYLIGSIMSMFRKIKEHTVTTTNDDLSVESEIKIEEIFNILENGINDILKNYKMKTISFDEFEDIKNDIDIIFEDNDDEPIDDMQDEGKSDDLNKFDIN